MNKKEKQILQDELEENYKALYFYQFCHNEDRDEYTKSSASDALMRVGTLVQAMYALGLHAQVNEANEQSFKNAKYAFEHRNI